MAVKERTELGSAAVEGGEAVTPVIIGRLAEPCCACGVVDPVAGRPVYDAGDILICSTCGQAYLVVVKGKSLCRVGSLYRKDNERKAKALDE